MSTRNEGNLDSIVYARVGNQSEGEANLTASQQFSVPKGVISEFLQFPSSSAPTFGSVHVYDLKQKGIIVHNVSLVLNTSNLTGISGSVNRMIPALLWFNRIELVINGSIVDSYTGEQLWIKQQMIMTDDDRVYLNSGTGNYASPTQRQSMANVSGQDYIVPIHGLFDEASVSLLTDAHAVQIKAYMKPLAECATSNSGFTGTGILTLNSAFLLAKISRFNSTIYDQRLAQLKSAPENYLFHDTKSLISVIPAGVSQAQVVLSAITGRVTTLVFTVKPLNGLIGDGVFTYTKIRNFSIINSGGTNVTTGTPISDHVYSNYICPYISDSSYFSETATGSTQYGQIQNNAANVYAYTFSHNNVECLKRGVSSSHVEFKGNEQLIITFPSTLGSAHQLEIFAYCESALELSETSCVKLTL